MRLRNLIAGDIRFQWTYGFYLIYVILCMVYICLLAALPKNWREMAASLLIYSDPAAMGMFFMGAIVLLEKSQRVLNSIVVSPVKVSEYILSKVLSIGFISVFSAVVIAVPSIGLKNIGYIIMGTFFTSVMFSFIGLAIGANSSSLNKFIIATIPIGLLCMIPPVFYLFIPNWLMDLFPPNIGFALVNGNMRNPWLQLPILLITIYVLYKLTYKSVSRSFKNMGGLKL